MESCILKISGRGSGNVISVSRMAKELGIKLQRGDLIRAHNKGRNKILLEKVKVISDKT